jgi:hypothetical protein
MRLRSSWFSTPSLRRRRNTSTSETAPNAIDRCVYQHDATTSEVGTVGQAGVAVSSCRPVPRRHFVQGDHGVVRLHHEEAYKARVSAAAYGMGVRPRAEVKWKRQRLSVATVNFLSAPSAKPKCTGQLTGPARSQGQGPTVPCIPSPTCGRRYASGVTPLMRSASSSSCRR